AVRSLEKVPVAGSVTKQSFHLQGGPWSRYFARQLDLTVLALIAALVIEFVLPHASMPTYIEYTRSSEAVIGLVILPVALALNALCLSLFGNSLGKTLFGLKVVPADGSERFTFWGNLRREFKVWVYGLALGIPIIALFTMARNYREVGSGRSATYDKGFANVKVKEISLARRAVSMMFAGFLVLGLVLVSAIGKEEARKSAKSQEWTNPVSGLSTRVPAGWALSTTNAPDDSTLYTFVAADQTKLVYFAAETVGGNTELLAYADAIGIGVSKTVIFKGDWKWESAFGTRVARRDGAYVQHGWPVTYLLAKKGNRFWRMVVTTIDGSSHEEATTMPLAESLFRTAN
ncbi:MAG: RDD family protein, partial [Beijerinckiaceae bacterium]|nr:RDD family protein [Beijerinckiaceae bacterium]